MANRTLRKRYLGQVATKGCYPDNKFSAPNTQSMNRIQHFARDYMSGFQLKYVNYYGPSETGPGSDLVVRASIEYPIGSVPTRVTFSGSDTATIASGGQVLSDPVALDIPDGAMFREWVYITCANGILYHNSSNNVDLVQLGASATDRTATGPTGSTTGMSGNQFVYGAAAIIGMTAKPSVFIIGDSRQAGTGSYQQYGTNDVGNLARPIGGALAYIQGACAGANLWQFRDNTTALKYRALADYCSHIAIGGGINDLNGGTSGANMKTLLQQLIAVFNPTGRKPVFVCPVEPYTTGTYADAAGQTIWDATKNGHRNTHNDNIRSGLIVGAWGVFDIARAVEDPANPGKWLSPGYTADGLHCTIKGDMAQAHEVNPAYFGNMAQAA